MFAKPLHRSLRLSDRGHRGRKSEYGEHWRSVEGAFIELGSEPPPLGHVDERRRLFLRNNQIVDHQVIAPSSLHAVYVPRVIDSHVGAGHGEESHVERVVWMNHPRSHDHPFGVHRTRSPLAIVH